MTSLTASNVTSLVASISEQPSTYENVISDVYDALTSGQMQQLAAISRPTTQSAQVSHVPALSLAADADQLRLALARLLVSPLGHHLDAAAAAAAAATTTTTAAGLADGAARQRARRPVDRSASEPLSSFAESSPASLGRYKTELCRPFDEHGSCKYGDKCQFAHGPAELRPVARHPKYKTDLCRTYHTTGLCPYGPRCHFIHNDDERRLIELNRVVVARQRALLCRQVLVEAAAAALDRRRRRQLAPGAVDARGSIASRSPSPPSSSTTPGDEPSTARAADEPTSWTAAAVATLGRRVRRAAPQMTDAEVQMIVCRLLTGAAVADPSSVYHHPRQPHHVQLQQQDAVQRHQPSVARSTLNFDERLLAL